MTNKKLACGIGVILFSTYINVLAAEPDTGSETASEDARVKTTPTQETAPAQEQAPAGGGETKSSGKASASNKKSNTTKTTDSENKAPIEIPTVPDSEQKAADTLV